MNELKRFVKMVAIGLQAALEYISMTLFSFCIKLSFVFYISFSVCDAMTRADNNFMLYAKCIIAIIMSFPILTFLMSYICKKIANSILA